MSVCRKRSSPIAAAALAAVLLPFSAQVTADPDVSVQKTIDDPVFGAIGVDLREFTVTVTNHDSVAHAVEVVDQLPTGLAIPVGMSATTGSGTYDADTGLWSVGQLDPGQSADLLIPVIADGNDVGCITNSATATFSDPGIVDVNLANNDAEVTVAATECSALAASSFPISEFIGVLNDVWFFTVRVEVRNDGPSAARSVVVEGSVSSPTYRDLTIRLSSGNCVSSIPVRLSCEFPLIAVDGEDVVEFVFNDPVDGNFQWSFDVSQAGDDPDMSNNSVSGTFAFRRDEAVDIAESGDCFIATAAYGSSLEPRLDILREFRDRHLLHHDAGRRLVAFYYRHSPLLARQVAQSEVLRAATRAALEPIIAGVHYAGLDRDLHGTSPE